MRQLLDALKTNNKLSYLDISSNFGGCELGYHIEEFLQVNESVKILNLRNLRLQT